MSLSDDLSFSLEKFSGQVRLFPLPNLVVFPHVMQPLHIFEPRYRAMLEESLADDGLIGMTLLAPGWETDYDGRPPLRPFGCLCRVASSHRTDEGSYNVLVLGLRRIKLVRELPPDKPFRVAEVSICEDGDDAASDGERAALSRQLVDAFRGVLPQLSEATDQFDQLFEKPLPLGMLTDIVAYTLDIDLDFKEQLLAESCVDLRAKSLVSYLERMRKAVFPPEFSLN